MKQTASLQIHTNESLDSLSGTYFASLVQYTDPNPFPCGELCLGTLTVSHRNQTCCKTKEKRTLKAMQVSAKFIAFCFHLIFVTRASVFDLFLQIFVKTLTGKVHNDEKREKN